MEPSALKKRRSVTSKRLKRLIVTDPFGGHNRLSKEFVVVDAAPRRLALKSKLWSRLPEELLLEIFARLPVKEILRMRSLNRAWRSSITSPHFQAAFEGASLVRIALMVHDKVDGTMFLTQEDGQECFRPGIARCPEVASKTRVAATVNGLVCVIEHEKEVRTDPPVSEMLGIRVFVMNVVTGFRRALPDPTDMHTLPSLVQMDRTAPGGGYTITFIYDLEGHRVAWEVYDSAENRWSKTLKTSMALVKDREVFTMHCALSSAFFYEKRLAIFNTWATKWVKVLRLREFHGNVRIGKYIAYSLHDVSGDLYILRARGGQHGVWRRRFMSFETWELICECPEVEGGWIYFRVMNDLVVLVFMIPYRCQPDAQLSGVVPVSGVGTVVKVFHMPTKSWHSFPEKDYVIQNWGCLSRDDFRSGPFLVEAKFDVVP